MVLQLLAKTAPETWVQRLGALVFDVCSLGALIVVGSIVFQTWNGPWTMTGLTASVFGLATCSLLTFFGIAHALSALFPKLIGAKQTRSSLEPFDTGEMNAEKLRFLYQLIGWLTLIGLSVIGFL
ncbi:hypothetical protein [Ruegeria arenilitoris]|uniref:hypothetical protein n=1 Tax=Ruegeria arenilitoris TaxID=1173585 RepID=UPI001CFDD493|nr:hypothetical protein [Ruegeria arenilitoris]